MPRSLLRIIDANANRAREALRVMEDLARFSLDDGALCAELKSLRHDLAAAMRPLESAAIIAHRDTPGDVGTGIFTEAERTRATVRDIAAAACKRLTESLRSIEECAKAVEPPGAPPAESPAARSARFESLRYRAYDAEKRLLLGIPPSRGVFRGWRLCLLLTESLCGRHPWLKVARFAIEGGADCIQLREKTLPDAELLARARSLIDHARPHGVAVIINDRPDIALASGADGVHLGQGDMPVAEARKILGFDRLIGVSTSNIDEARAALLAGADYCGAGPMFPSTTKEKARLAGPAYLREYLAHDPPLPPVLAISGMTRERIIELAHEVGHAEFGVAVSSAVCAAESPESQSRWLREARIVGAISARDPKCFRFEEGGDDDGLKRCVSALALVPAVQDEITTAVQRRDLTDFSLLMEIQETACHNTSAPGPGDSIPDWHLDSILDLLDRAEIPDGEFAHRVFLWFDSEWNVYTEEQQRRIVDATARAFPRIRHPQAAFVASMVLGELSHNRHAYDALCRLQEAGPMPNRCSLPHGFEHIAKDSGDPALTAEAIARLLEMMAEPDEAVSGAARASLDFVRWQGFTVPDPPA